jgi:CRP-like cAMP-binding protein
MVSVEGLSRLHYFTEMRGDELASIAPHFEERSVEDGAVIYRAGESADFLYGISHGDVELDMPLFHGGEGEKSLVRLQDGSIFGIGEIFFQNYYLTAHARSRTLLYAVPRMVFLQTILPLPAVNKKVLEDFAFMTRSTPSSPAGTRPGSASSSTFRPL